MLNAMAILDLRSQEEKNEAGSAKQDSACIEITWASTTTLNKWA